MPSHLLSFEASRMAYFWQQQPVGLASSSLDATARVTLAWTAFFFVLPFSVTEVARAEVAVTLLSPAGTPNSDLAALVAVFNCDSTGQSLLVGFFSLVLMEFSNTC